MELFSIDLGLAVWTWIVFGVMFFILSKYVFPPLLGALKSREDSIALSVDKVMEIEKRLGDIENEKDGIIKETKTQAAEILRQARLSAEKLNKEQVSRAEREAREILDAARARLDEERAQLVRSLRSDIADFVCDVSGKVVQRSFSGDMDRDWVEELAEKI